MSLEHYQQAEGTFAWSYDKRRAEPLAVEHGIPVRQVMPGLYGYVSATKWVLDWDTRPGDYRAEVRATDTGQMVQGQARVDPIPDGLDCCRGIFVTVT